MKKLSYNAMSTVAGIVAAVAARKLVSALWRSDTQTPLNPADRRTSWREALAWGLATAVGAAVARIVALRGAAAGWEKMTGETPPGVAS
ncbi:MAG TPA: DUF4235 domain-containing protein [Ilumatobacteraceae bacterium]|nr:DUF4235 domain-containing protein [Ilumatobacteraceae bacterium]